MIIFFVLAQNLLFVRWKRFYLPAPLTFFLLFYETLLCNYLRPLLFFIFLFFLLEGVTRVVPAPSINREVLSARTLVVLSLISYIHEWSTRCHISYIILYMTMFLDGLKHLAAVNQNNICFLIQWFDWVTGPQQCLILKIDLYFFPMST